MLVVFEVKLPEEDGRLVLVEAVAVAPVVVEPVGPEEMVPDTEALGG